MPAIYVIGAGRLGLNTLTWARECGLYVVATDRCPDAPGADLADEFHVVDGADVEGQLACARSIEEPVVEVLSGGDFAIRTVERLRTHLGLETNDTVAIDTVLDKTRLKRVFHGAGIPAPATRTLRRPRDLEALLAEAGGPWVIKPAGGSGSRGVRLVRDRCDAEAEFAASRGAVAGETALVAEPFHTGRCIDANGLFLDGEFHPCGVLEKFTGPAPCFLPLGGCDPPDLPERERDEVYHLLERAARAVGIIAGPVKGDFLRTDEGYLTLEVAPRFHGDVTTCNTLPFGSGIDPLRFWFHYLATGRKDRTFLERRFDRRAVWRVLPLPPGRILNLPGPESARGFERITKVWHNPDLAGVVPRYEDSATIPGYVCAWGEDFVHAEAVIARWFAGAGYRVDPDPAHAKWFAALQESLHRRANAA